MPKFIFTIFAIFLSVIAHSDDGADISKEKALDMWNKSSKEPIEIQNIFTAYTVSKEKVYLVNSYFQNRGINSMVGVVLIRPLLGEIKDVSEEWVSVDSVMDMNNDGVSEIYSVKSGLGQGEFSENNTIFQIDNWKIIKIKESISENTEGAYGKESSKYYSHMYKWSFLDINDDGVLDIVEVENDENGVEGKEPLKSEKTRKFIFNGNSFSELNM